MLHFAHFKRRAERTEDGKYILSLEYDESDEAELVIRVLSFGLMSKFWSHRAS